MALGLSYLKLGAARQTVTNGECQDRLFCPMPTGFKFGPVLAFSEAESRAGLSRKIVMVIHEGQLVSKPGPF